VLFGKRAHPFLKEDMPFCYASLKLLAGVACRRSFILERLFRRVRTLFTKKRDTNDKKIFIFAGMKGKFDRTA